MLSFEGTRSYGAGLARAAVAAGIPVIEGGDRALNKANHVIANTRMRTDPATQAYVLCRQAQGTSDREIRRCITPYITRHLFRALTAAMTTSHRGNQHVTRNINDAPDRSVHSCRLSYFTQRSSHLALQQFPRFAQVVISHVRIAITPQYEVPAQGLGRVLAVRCQNAMQGL